MKQLLLDCLHQDYARFPAGQLARLDATGWGDLCRLAVEHRVVPMLHHRLVNARNSTKPIPSHPGWLEWTLQSQSGPAALSIGNLGGYARQVARNNLGFFAELQNYLGLLNDEDIPVILLKGVWLAHEVYPGKGLREMNDIDLLFQTGDLPRACSLIADMGYTSAKPIHIETEIKKSHHLPPMMKKGTAVVELHWNITRPGRSYSIQPGGLWQRATTATITGKPARLLSPEDQLLHLCLHTSYQHTFSFGLRPYCDITETIRHYGPDLEWDLLIQRAEEYGWTKGTWLVLTMAASLLGADVPTQVLSDMQPSDSCPDLQESAENQLFTQKALAASIPLQMVGMIKTKKPATRLKTLWADIFLSRENMATRYYIRSGSPIILVFYLIRICQLTRRYAINLIRIYRGDELLTGVVDRKARLNEWMGDGRGDRMGLKS